MELHNQALREHIVSGLNTEQTAVFDECISGTSSIFCTGKGGTGKSRTVESIIKYFKEAQLETKIQVAVTALTGVAAYLIGGITLHRFAGIGITEDDKQLMLAKACKGKSHQYWTQSHILIIDEVSMMSSQLFDNLSYVAQQIRSSAEPFGGIRLMMFGDFLQLPPVSRSHLRVSRAFESDTWKYLDLATFTLNSIKRQQDNQFAEMVSRVRLGDCADSVDEYFRSLSRNIDYDDGIEPVRLYSLKATTDQYNQSRLDAVATQPKTYSSLDSGDQRSLLQCPAPKTLRLKTGCQVMLIRNVNETAVNGSIGTVVGFRYVNEAKSFQPLVQFIGHNQNLFTMPISRQTWETTAPDGVVTSSRKQIPLILAWAVTIHKSQGQTIPRLYVDLEGVFEYGQAYVALSRCTDPNSLQVSGFSKDIVKADSECVRYYKSLHGSDATNVATHSQQLWDSHTADTLTMLGHLSIRETS